RMDTGVGWKAHFGVQARSRELRELASELGRSRWVRVRAVHSHVESSVREVGLYRLAVGELIRTANDLQREFRLDVDTIDVGGGFGAPTVKRFTAQQAGMYRLLNRAPRAPDVKECATVDQFAETISTCLRDASAGSGVR